MPSIVSRWRRRLGLAIAGEVPTSPASRPQYQGSDYEYCTRTPACPYGRGHEGACSVC